jgi:hypothetical protein
MSKALHSQVLQAVTDRKNWEDKQRVWYKMRHDGLPRRNKPYPGAADLHFPLIDSAVDKFKPFYLNAVFGVQLLASFTPLDPMLGDAQGAGEQAFDWLTRNKTNFEEELDATFDAMLVAGRTVMKYRWDTESKTVEYEAIDPTFFIVPSSTVELEKAPWCCHVKQVSLTDYKLTEAYTNQSPDFIKRIRGGQDPAIDSSGKEDDKMTREGLTHSKDDQTIILFEVWVRDAKGWIVHTFSPSAPESPVREPFRCPYQFQGKPFLPFVSFHFEVKDRGWYSPRGVAERLAPYETYASKIWNAKADALDFVSKPLFTSDNPLANNTSNFRFRPGDFLPPTTRQVQMSAPPVALDQEINNTRLIAQENIQVPDFGTSEEGAGQTKTATEMNYVASFAGQGVQYRGRIAFRSLAKVYRGSWALWVQFGGDQLTYFCAETRKVLPQQAKTDNYLIQPNGSPDQWNRQQRLQRAVSRFQMFNGHPNVNQEELVKCILEEDDPRLVKRLFISTKNKQANESEDEAMEIVLMLNGWPAVVSPGEDHRLRISILTGKLQQLAATGAPVNPQSRTLIQQHLVQHMQMLKQENPKAATGIGEAISALDPAHNPAAAPGGPPLPGSAMGPGQGFPGTGAPQSPVEAMAV